MALRCLRKLCDAGSTNSAGSGNERSWLPKITDPQRVERLARIRFHFERLGTREVMVFADELNIHLLPKVGYAWIPKGARELVMTPGQNAKHYLAGALNLTHREAGALLEPP